MMPLYLILLVVITLCVILGIRRGLFLEIISFWNLFISFVLTFTLFEALAQFLKNFLSSFLKIDDDVIISGISFSALFILFFVIFSILNSRIFGKVKIKLISLIDKLGGVLLGIIRGFIITSLIFIVLAMFLTTGSIGQEKENLNPARNIYLIVPKFYEYLVNTLSSESHFDSQIFLKTYGGFLKKEADSQIQKVTK